MDVTVEREIELADRVIIASEDWADSYKKNPDALAKLIKGEAKIAKLLRRYFRDFAKERVGNYVNWQRYHQQVINAAAADVIVDVKEIVDGENDILINVIHDPLQQVLALGAATAEQKYNLDLGLGEHSATIMKATTKYIGDLVTNINQTTRDNIRQSISTSLQLREDLATAQARMDRVVNNPKRATVIARTETVRAYGKGTTEFGKASGATEKIWEISSDPCEICKANDIGPIPFGEAFPSGDMEPPGHPNCRCDESLVHNYGSNDNTNNDE